MDQQREPFEQRMYHASYERHAAKARELALTIRAQASRIVHALDASWIPPYDVSADAVLLAGHITAMAAMREIKEVFDAGRADLREQIGAEIENVIGGYPDNEMTRPKIETGRYVNDAQWAAMIARGQQGGYRAEQADEH